MAVRTLYIKSNGLTPSNVLIPDMGILVLSGGNTHTVDTDIELQQAKGSINLQAFLIDDAYGSNSSTLILNNGTSDVAQDQALSYLQNFNSTVVNSWFGGW